MIGTCNNNRKWQNDKDTDKNPDGRWKFKRPRKKNWLEGVEKDMRTMNMHIKWRQKAGERQEMANLWKETNVLRGL